MTEAAQTTKRGRGRPKGSANTVPAMDFGSLTPAAATVPVKTGGVRPQDNPAIAWLRKSWEKQTQLNNSGSAPTYIGEGQSLVIPADQAENLKALIRKAADFLNLGVTIPEPFDKVAGGKVKVVFAAKTRKRPPAKKVQTPAEGSESSAETSEGSEAQQ